MGTKGRWFELPLRALTSCSWLDNRIRGIALGFLEKNIGRLNLTVE